MKTALLELNGIGKVYREYGSEWHRVLAWFGINIGKPRENRTLNAINLSFNKGESVGIVGQNGAGKSTLLKIITGTLKPTEGSVSVHGRISAILELGMGFHPDLTGRQNSYHAAGLMGYKHEEIEAAMETIAAFAEIGEYFDQSVRTYSSGMQMRVAFAVATAFRPDLLIVDEALSVGDTYFQHKCFERIREYQNQGTTLLLVSHDRASITSVCDRAVLIEKGEVIQDGDPEAVMDYYNALIADKEVLTLNQEVLDNGRIATRSGSGEATTRNVLLINAQGESVENVESGEHVRLRIEIDVHADIPRLVLGYMIKDRMGQVLFGTNTDHLKDVLIDVKKGENLVYEFEFDANFGIGSYSVSTALVSSDTHLINNYEWRDLALVFSATNTTHPHFVGSMWMNPTYKVERT